MVKLNISIRTRLFEISYPYFIIGFPPVGDTSLESKTNSAHTTITSFIKDDTYKKI